jgi:hypothetical protein
MTFIYSCIAFIILLFPFSIHTSEVLKVLHLCFHDGCAHEIDGIAKGCQLDVTTMKIFDMKPYAFDPDVEGGQVLYNIDAGRAERIWNQHKNYFETFDAVIVSDTTALSRIFLQNHWKKPLIIWITNRYDWCWLGEKNRVFPDKAYYHLLRDAKKHANVFFVPSSSFENFWAKKKKIDFGHRIIQHAAAYLPDDDVTSHTPQETKKKLFIHKRTEDLQAPRLFPSSICSFLEGIHIAAHSERYNHVQDLSKYQAVLYLSYQWCVISMFETLRLGLPTFVPSERFLLSLLHETNYYFEHKKTLIKKQNFELAEWYRPEFKDIFIYFDSWDDLAKKVATTDYSDVRAKTLAQGKRHSKEMIRRWQTLFDEVRAIKQN